MEEGLTYTELFKIAETLKNFEAIKLKETLVDKFFGGFVRAEMFGFDEDFVYFELLWGNKEQAGESATNSKEYKINRVTFVVMGMY